jgi:hypothetical protein
MFLWIVVKKISHGLLNAVDWLAGDSPVLSDVNQRINVERLAVVRRAHFALK